MENPSPCAERDTTPLKHTVLEEMIRVGSGLRHRHTTAVIEMDILELAKFGGVQPDAPTDAGLPHPMDADRVFDGADGGHFAAVDLDADVGVENEFGTGLDRQGIAGADDDVGGDGVGAAGLGVEVLGGGGRLERGGHDAEDRQHAEPCGSMIHVVV